MLVIWFNFILNSKLIVVLHEQELVSSLSLVSAFGNQFAGAGTRTVLGALPLIAAKSHFILLLLELCFKLLDLAFI